MMIQYKHYIRLNESGDIIKSFSDAFETPLETDVLYETNEERHFNLSIYNDRFPGKYRLKYVNSAIVEKTDDEMETLDEVKARRIYLLKLNTTNCINAKYEPFRRENAALGVEKYASLKDTYANYIESCIAYCDSVEAQINAATSKEAVYAIDVAVNIA